MVKTKQVAPNLHLVEPRATEKTYREQTIKLRERLGLYA